MFAKLESYLPGLCLLLFMHGGIASHVAAPEVKIDELEVGEGRAAQPMSVVEVHYTGKLEDGTVFDSSRERGEPFKFTLGSGQVIPGWDQGIRGMMPGGKRVLTIPPQLAYGSRGAGNVIPPDATLTFEVELLGLTPPPFASVDSAGLQKMLDDGVKLIDIRRPDEWQATGVIEGSIRSTAFDAQGRFLPAFAEMLQKTVGPDEEFALICRTGNRTAALSNWLVTKGGYKNVVNVRDGIVSWLGEDRPVEKPAE